MTNGTVVVLGEAGRNFGAGMTGGRAFVHDPLGLLPLRLNDELVSGVAPDDAEADELYRLVERHGRHTGSARAAALLGDWESELPHFRVVAPRAEVAELESASEGTG